MRLARVLGQVVSTVKDPRLSSYTLLLIAETDTADGAGPADPVSVAVDLIGAGVGELVLVVAGSAARIAVGGSADSTAPVDRAVVAITDSVIHEGTVTYSTGSAG